MVLNLPIVGHKPTKILPVGSSGWRLTGCKAYSSKNSMQPSWCVPKQSHLGLRCNSSPCYLSGGLSSSLKSKSLFLREGKKTNKKKQRNIEQQKFSQWFKIREYGSTYGIFMLKNRSYMWPESAETCIKYMLGMFKFSKSLVLQPPLISKHPRALKTSNASDILQTN